MFPTFVARACYLNSNASVKKNNGQRRGPLGACMYGGGLKLDHLDEEEHNYAKLDSVVSTYTDAHFKKNETVRAILLLHV